MPRLKGSRLGPAASVRGDRPITLTISNLRRLASLCMASKPGAKSRPSETWSCGTRKAGASSSFIKRTDFKLGSWRRPGLSRWRFNLATLLNPARA